MSETIQGVSIMNGMMYLSVALFAYLIGSAPFALVVSKAMKLADPRSYGSRNPGATNVLRSGSLRAAALTFAGDAGKGGLAVWVAACALRRFGASSGLGNEVIALAALCVFMGHVWPVFFRFRAAGACQPQPAFCSPFIQRSARPARRPGASSHFSFAIHRSRRLSQRYLRPFTKC